jgi:hypothetical protein
MQVWLVSPVAVNLLRLWRFYASGGAGHMLGFEYRAHFMFV